MAKKYAYNFGYFRGLLSEQAKTFRKEVYATVKYESLTMLSML